MADEGPKIIIDEDWKARAQREKEEAARLAEEQAVSEEAPRQPEQVSFTTLVSMLAMQTMMALGAVAPQGTQELYIDLDEAKFNLDLLAILREKTKNNLTPEEQGMLQSALADLQQGFVVRSQQIQEAALQQGMSDPGSALRP